LDHQGGEMLAGERRHWEGTSEPADPPRPKEVQAYPAAACHFVPVKA